MINKKTGMIIGVFLVVIVFLFTLSKTITYTKKTEINHDLLRSTKLNTIITGVAISRILEIKIQGVSEWVTVSGCKLNLKENQVEPKDHYQKGDSIIKEANSNYYIIKRGNEIFNWVIE